MQFLPFNQEPLSKVTTSNGVEINCFNLDSDSNIDEETVKSFGEEWLKFDTFNKKDLDTAGSQYFDIVSSDILNKNTVVLDLGCGSGRWSKYIANKVKLIEAIDPSQAVLAAAKLNHNENNVRITQAPVSNIPFEDSSFDFVICLGVLHHIPNTSEALKRIVKKVKPGGYILLYLYYNLDNRGIIYKLLFWGTNIIRLLISKFPARLKKMTCDLIAYSIYLPLKIFALVCSRLFSKKEWISKLPLSYYKDKSINIIRNDSLDRFGTPLEQRFSKKHIEQMMLKSGLADIIFSENEPYWHALGKKTTLPL